MTRRRVVVESPFAGATPALIARNIRYVRACLRDCLLRSEAPFASHAIFTLPGILRDEVPSERKMGMEAGWEWIAVSDATVVCTDLGISSGMQRGIDLAKAQGRTVETRQLGAAWDRPVSGDPLRDLSVAMFDLIADVDDAMRDVDPAASWDEIKKRALAALRASEAGS